MSTYTRTFKDHSGDELGLSVDSVGINIEITYSNGIYSIAEFDLKVGEQIADAIYEGLGVGVVPKDAVKASDISYNEAAVRLAAIHGRKIRFRYAKELGAPIELRLCVPENVYTSGSGEVYFKSFDPDRDDYRNFRLDRIAGDVEVLSL